jgi:hypothetical protein
MLHGDALEGRFVKRARSRPIAYAAEIGDDGLVLGAGTILARMNSDSPGEPLDLEGGEDRLHALLAAAHGRPMSPHLPRHLGEAFAHWRRGEKALANIRLAFAQIPRLDDRSDAYRLFLAEELLDAGMSPAALMKALGFDPSRRDLAKYDPNQPRVPAGSGRNSGRWGSGGGGAQAPAPAASIPAPAAAAMRAASAPGTLADGLFASVADSAFLSGLETLASATVGPAAMLGAIFVPTPAGVVSHGAMPGEPGLSYSFDEPAGLLRLYRDDETGWQTIAEARLRPDGILAETETGLPIARMVGGSLVFEADSLPDAKAEAEARNERDEPKLCPDPGPDVQHGASERAMLYQEQISALNNPRRPLSRGDAISLMNPETGKSVVFDDCRESDGTMIEAKGPGYAQQMNYPYFDKSIVPGWEDQARTQVAAAGGRDVAWFFAEPEAADRARKLFENDDELHKIKVFYVPAETQ